jgi:hypothetical protein
MAISIFKYIVCSHIYPPFRQKFCLCFVERPIQSTLRFHPSALASRQTLTMLKYLGFTFWVYIMVASYHFVNLRYIQVPSTSPN